MPGYRLYCLNGAGRFAMVHEIDAAGDAEALSIARQMELPVKCELWEGSRKLAVLDACRA
jgi:hypothetical protein